MKVLDYYWLKDIYTSDPALSDEWGESCWFNKYGTADLKTFWHLFLMSEERVAMRGRPWYVGWRVCHDKVAEQVKRLYEKPGFLGPDIELDEPWIHIGTPGLGAKYHLDNVGFSSWQAQISGSKTW